LARRFHAAGRAVLESASAAFQAAADQPSVGARFSATSPTKKPDVVVTPGFVYSSGTVTA